MIDLGKVAGSNIPKVQACTGRTGFLFRSEAASPDGEPFFFVAYEFQVDKDGLYGVNIKGPGSGVRENSRYAIVVDNGEAVPALTARRVSSPDNPARWHAQMPVRLAAGKHTLEFRFHPAQRLHQMNRVTEPFAGHSVKIEAVRIDAIAEQAAQPNTPSRGAERKLELKNGDRIVLLGDSITDEGFYARHLVRLLQSGYPGEAFQVYNAGIALNRTMEALERLELDVLALRPQWVVIAFGVNDGVHIAPDEFISNYRNIVTRLQDAGIGVLCATPSGVSPDPDKNGQYFHTPDRARGFDETLAIEAGLIMDLARELNCPCADVLGAFTRAGLDRKALMGSQWHPGDEGSRVFALALLRALGFSKADAEGAKDPRDAAAFDAIAAMPPASYPIHSLASSVSSHIPEGRMIAASSFTGNAVHVFALESGERLATVPVGHHPMGLAYSPKRKELYVACEGAGRIEIIAVPGFTKIGSIALGDVYPVAIALSKDESTAWTANFFGSSTSEINLAKRSLVRTLNIGGLGEGVAPCPDGTALLVASRKNTIRVDLKNWQVADKIMTSDYASAFFVDANGLISAIDTVAWTLHPFDLAAKTCGPATPAPFPSRTLIVDPTTGDLLAGDCGDGAVVRISKATGAKRKIADVRFPFGLALIDMNPPAQR